MHCFALHDTFSSLSFDGSASLLSRSKEFNMIRIFLHGLESSSRGVKAAFLRDHFPDMIIPDFRGSLSERMKSLNSILRGRREIILVGSSFGGLMATLYAMENGDAAVRLVLLAPALNFPDFSGYGIKQVSIPARMIMGKHDTVTPAEIVLPIARSIFADLTYDEVNDDHILAGTFRSLDWKSLLHV
jgi:predicted esterase